MTLELSAEEIVTNLLSSNEVIKAKCENKYISYQDIDLGKFSMRFEDGSELAPSLTLPLGEGKRDSGLQPPHPSPLPAGEGIKEPSENSESSKYSFIRSKWVV